MNEKYSYLPFVDSSHKCNFVNVFCAFAFAEKKIEKIAEQIAVGVSLSGVASTKLIINKSAKTGAVKFIVCEKNSGKGSDVLE